MLQTGKVAGVYARLPPASALNYDELKKDLFERFEVTNEDSREKFITSKSDGSETFSQFLQGLTIFSIDGLNFLKLKNL